MYSRFGRLLNRWRRRHVTRAIISPWTDRIGGAACRVGLGRARGRKERAGSTREGAGGGLELCRTGPSNGGAHMWFCPSRAWPILPCWIDKEGTDWI